MRFSGRRLWGMPIYVDERVDPRLPVALVDVEGTIEGFSIPVSSSSVRDERPEVVVTSTVGESPVESFIRDELEKRLAHRLFTERPYGEPVEPVECEGVEEQEVVFPDLLEQEGRAFVLELGEVVGELVFDVSPLLGR